MNLKNIHEQIYNALFFYGKQKHDALFFEGHIHAGFHGVEPFFGDFYYPPVAESFREDGGNFRGVFFEI